MSEINETPLDPKAAKAAETAAKAAAAEAAAAMAPQRVIVRRPFGNNDSHQWFGFNGWGAQIQFDEPVNMPAGAVKYLRAAKRVEYRADPTGAPVASYSAAYNIEDAPLGSEE